MNYLNYPNGAIFGLNSYLYTHADIYVHDHVPFKVEISKFNKKKLNRKAIVLHYKKAKAIYPSDKDLLLDFILNKTNK